MANSIAFCMFTRGYWSGKKNSPFTSREHEQMLLAVVEPLIAIICASWRIPGKHKKWIKLPNSCIYMVILYIYTYMYIQNLWVLDLYDFISSDTYMYTHTHMLEACLPTRSKWYASISIYGTCNILLRSLCGYTITITVTHMLRHETRHFNQTAVPVEWQGTPSVRKASMTCGAQQTLQVGCSPGFPQRSAASVISWL